MRSTMLCGLGAGLLLVGAADVIPLGYNKAQAAETKKKKKNAGGDTKSRPAPLSANTTPPAVIGPASALLFAPQNDAMARLFATPYGKSTNFELKLNAGDFVDVEVAVPNGSAIVQVCYTPDNILASVWGSSDVRCPGPASLDHSTARYRMEARGKAEVKVKVSRSTGDASETYTVRVRGRTSGRGAEMLAMFERMRDRFYVRESSNDGLMIRAVHDYRIETPGKSGVLRYRDESGVNADTRFELTPEGDLAWYRDQNKGLVQPGNDGALYLNFPGEGSIGYAFGSQGLITRYQYAQVNFLNEKAPKDQGGFQLTGTQILGPISPSLADMVIAKGPGAVAAAKAKRMADWGVLRLMAGHSFAFTTPAGKERVVTYAWDQEGRTLVGKYWDGNAYGTAPSPLLRLSHNGETGKISGHYTSSDGKAVQATTLENSQDNTLTERFGAVTASYKLQSANEIAYNEGPGKNAWAFRLLNEKDLAMFRQRTQEYQAQLAQQQAQKKSGGSGLLGMALGAAVGGALASSGGLDANQTLGAMMKGAAVGAGNSQNAGALNSLGDSLMSNSGSTGGLGFGAPGNAGLGGNHAGSYPTKPNLAADTCPGFTEGNYRQRALNGGGDTQLFTMCGQAYEYYTMYKRAIAQGYAEADANRTYAAHEGAALNAQNFARNWK